MARVHVLKMWVEWRQGMAADLMVMDEMGHFARDVSRLVVVRDSEVIRRGVFENK